MLDAVCTALHYTHVRSMISRYVAKGVSIENARNTLKYVRSMISRDVAKGVCI